MGIGAHITIMKNIECVCVLGHIGMYLTFCEKQIVLCVLECEGGFQSIREPYNIPAKICSGLVIAIVNIGMGVRIMGMSPDYEFLRRPHRNLPIDSYMPI